MSTCHSCNQVIPRGALTCAVCGATVVAGETTLIDGRYLVEGELGRGAMGVVYIARDVNLGRRVAIKMMAAAQATDPAVVAGFQREAAALASVRDPHVVQVYAFGPHAGSWYFAMEHVEGETLEDLMRQHASHSALVPRTRALTIIRQVAEGLSAVHAVGLVHRDVKPSNIIVERESGRPVLIDFGLVAQMGEAASRGAGTPYYMAPEQIHSAGATSRSDVYALACTAFELLTGRVPFASDTSDDVFRRKLAGPPPLASSVLAAAARFDLALAAGLSRDPGLRPATASDFARALVDEPSSGALVHTIPAPPPVTERPPCVEVLVVDDDGAFRKLAARAVQLAFYRTPVRVEMAVSGDAALGGRRRAPHLVLLDYDMPGLDGIETLARLRELPGGADARVVVLSARVGDAERWRFSILGVSDFLQKPLVFAELVDRIQKIVERCGWAAASEADGL